MISFKQTGDFRRTISFLSNARHNSNVRILRHYGELGVEALKASTPRDTGKTANSWDYTITQTDKGYKLTWTNSNVVDGVPIAVILQYGHGTRNGGYVEGVDYINPSIRPIFDSIVKDLWREVKRN